MKGQSLTRTSCFVLFMLLIPTIAFGTSSGTTSSNPEESYMMRILDRTFTETSDAIITAQLDRMTWGSGEETQRLNLRILPKSGFIIFSGLMNVFFDCMNPDHITTGTPEIDVLVEYPSGESKWIPYGDFKELESVVKFFSLSSLASAGINIITAPHSLVYRMEVAIEAVDKALELLKLGAQSNWKEGGPPGSRYLMSGIAGIGAHLETCQIRGYWITMPLHNMGDKNCTLDTYVSFQQYFVNSGTYSAEFSLEVPPEETRVSEEVEHKDDKIVSAYVPSDIVPAMVYVEGGTFTMGDTWGGGRSDEKPTHTVVINYDFYIGRYEVTFAEYDRFCEETNRRKPSDSGWGRGQRPVINVSWWDAIAYCNWLSEKEGLPKAYDHAGNWVDSIGRVVTDPSQLKGYRLPTEAEWEFAARGGNKSRGYQYSGGSDVYLVAWYTENSGGMTRNVGTTRPNELGIYDMSGNVWEWCNDWYDSNYYQRSPSVNPYNYTPGSYRVLRGGSWDRSATLVRVAYRSYYSPTRTLRSLGFRISRTVH